MTQQRFQAIEGLTVADATGAKRVTMSGVDAAIAAFPGLVHDLDISRLVSDDASYLGRARGSGTKLLADGPGYSLVNSAYLNNKPAIRLNGGTGGHWLRLPRGITKPDFTLIAICTIGPEIRSGSIGSSRPFLNIYDGASPIIWTRFAATTSTLQFSTTAAASGAQILQSALPAANTASIFTFSRVNATNQNNINVNGASVVSATDTTVPTVTADKRLNIGAPDLLSPTRGFYGDVARVIAIDTNVVASYPVLFAEFIAAAKVEYGVA